MFYVVNTGIQTREIREEPDPSEIAEPMTYVTEALLLANIPKVTPVHKENTRAPPNKNKSGSKSVRRAPDKPCQAPNPLKDKHIL